MSFFFFKEKTAYDMRISDWRSDVCSSDLREPKDAARWAGTEMAGRMRSVTKQVQGTPHEFQKRYGPWVLIAGASEGVGAALAREMASRSINCMLVARRSEQLERLAEKIRIDFRVEVTTHSIDLATDCASADLASAVGDREIGTYIYNAGADTRADRFVDLPVDAWSGMVRRNVLTMMESCHFFAGAMARRGHGGLMIIGSEAALCAAARAGIYSATKAFGLALGEALWAEMAPQGVDVLNVLLGATDTPMLRERLRLSGISTQALNPPFP